jgi:hypothetical protein
MYPDETPEIYTPDGRKCRGYYLDEGPEGALYFFSGPNVEPFEAIIPADIVANSYLIEKHLWGGIVYD